MNNSDLLLSMQKNIGERLQKTDAKLERTKDRLENGKVSIIDKMFLKNNLKSLQQEHTNLVTLNQKLSSFTHNNQAQTSLPSDVKSALDSLGTVLNNEEITNLNNVIKSTIDNLNKSSKQGIENDAKEIEKLLKSLKLENNNFLLYNSYNQYQNSQTSFIIALEKIKKQEFMGEKEQYKVIHQDGTPLISDEIASFNSSLEELKQNKFFQNDKQAKNIIDNSNQIKEAYKNKVLSYNTLRKLDSCIDSMKNDPSLNDIKLYLEKVKNNYVKAYEKSNSYLEKFNIESLKDKYKKEIEKQREEKMREETKQTGMALYQELTYELQKTIANDPNNLNKIEDIKKQMREVKVNYKLDNLNLSDAEFKGKTKYTNEVSKEKAVIELSNESRLNEYNENKQAEIALREAAIKELQYSNNNKAIEYDVKNGDVYQKEEAESLIKAKMDELREMANLSVEERGLLMLKKRGYIDKDATVSMLSPQQLNDIRIGYSDSALGLTDYQKYKKQQTSNSIYKEYLIYRAKNQDKNEYMSFSQFAKAKYNLTMDESKLNEVIDKEGISR